MNANDPSIAGSRWPAILNKLKSGGTRRRPLSGEFAERSRGYYIDARLWVHVTGFAMVTLVGLVQQWVVGFAVAAIAGMAALHAALHRHAEVNLVRFVLIDVTAMGLGMAFIGIPTVASVLAIVLTFMASLLLGRWESFFVAGYAMTWAFLAYLFEDTVRRQSTGPWVNPDPWIVSVTVFGVVMVLVLSRRVVDLIGELESVRAQFMGGVAHDLRNPLTGVIGAASMLRDMGSDLTDGESAELIDIVVRQAVDANRMVEDLLTSARIDADGIDLQKTPVDMVELIDEILRFAPTDQRTSIVWAHPDRPIVVEADPMRIRQAIQNLVSNAVRYGGGEVEVRIDADADGVAVQVIDDGPGIADADLQRIFEPFGRGSAGVKNSASIGLGLFVSRRLARLMGGDLVYRRVEGKTVFEMRLPPVTRSTEVVSEDPGRQRAGFAEVWLGDDGVLRVVYLPVPAVEGVKEATALLDLCGTIGGGERRPLLVVTGGARPNGAALQLYGARLATVASAVAVVVAAPLARLIANSSVARVHLVIPIGLFGDETTALDWLAAMGSGSGSAGALTTDPTGHRRARLISGTRSTPNAPGAARPP